MELREHVRQLAGSSKFSGHDLRRTRLLYAISLEGGTDREVGTVDDFGWHGLIGKQVLREDNYGNVDHLDFATVGEAEAYLDGMEEGEIDAPFYTEPTPPVPGPADHLEAAYEDACSGGWDGE